MKASLSLITMLGVACFLHANESQVVEPPLPEGACPISEKTVVESRRKIESGYVLGEIKVETHRCRANNTLQVQVWDADKEAFVAVQFLDRLKLFGLAEEYARNKLISYLKAKKPNADLSKFQTVTIESASFSISQPVTFTKRFEPLQDFEKDFLIRGSDEKKHFFVSYYSSLRFTDEKSKKTQLVFVSITSNVSVMQPLEVSHQIVEAFAELQ